MSQQAARAGRRAGSQGRPPVQADKIGRQGRQAGQVDGPGSQGG